MTHRAVEALSRLLALVLVWPSACARHQQPARLEEITFQSGPFNVTGELRLPAGRGPFPVVLFVHGDGPNDRTSGGTYTPIMERIAYERENRPRREWTNYAPAYLDLLEEWLRRLKR